MHRALVGSTAAVVLASVSSAAFAADIAPPEPVPSWSGIYLGAGGGIQFGDLSGDTVRCTLLYARESDGRLCNPDYTFNDEFDDNDSSFAGVVQGGYNLQIGSYFVTGSFVSWTFGDSLGSDHKRVFDAEDGIFGKWNTQFHDMLTVGSRQGFLPMPNLLVFTLAGWSWADIDHSFKIDCDDCSDPIVKLGDNFNVNGYTVGIGAEYKVTDNISLRGEYRFTNLDSFNDRRFFDEGDHLGKTKVDGTFEQVLVTLNWNFGGLGLPF